MTNSIRECQAQANTCRNWAKKAAVPEIKAYWLHMAEEWESAAQRAAATTENHRSYH